MSLHIRIARVLVVPAVGIGGAWRYRDIPAVRALDRGWGSAVQGFLRPQDSVGCVRQLDLQDR